MMEFIISGAVVLLAIIALWLTIKVRKNLELSVFLFLIAFEIIVILASGWVFVIYGAVIEMGNLEKTAIPHSLGDGTISSTTFRHG